MSAAIGGLEGSPFPLLALSPSWPRGTRTIEARNASAFWTLLLSAPGSWSSTFCRFMHAILWTRSPPRTTHAVRARRISGSPGGTGIRGAESGGNPPLNQCLPGSRGAILARHAEDAPCGSGLARWRRDTPSCPAHVRAVDAPVCSVAAHAAGPVATAVLASNMSGIYALQAMGEDDADSHAYPEAPAEVVIDRMAAANVARFRRRHGLQVDTDFAYAFASWAEARDAGGQAIADAADAWSELRKAASAGAGSAAEGPPRVRFSWLVKRARARPGRRAVPTVSAGRWSRTWPGSRGLRAGQPAWGTLILWTCLPSFTLGRQLRPPCAGSLSMLV